MHADYYNKDIQTFQQQFENFPMRIACLKEGVEKYPDCIGGSGNVYGYNPFIAVQPWLSQIKIKERILWKPFVLAALI